MSKHQQFWNKEYRTSAHLALSDEPAEDLIKFLRWAERQEGRRQLNVTGRVLDLGCGNGRNLIYMAETYGIRGVGYDISNEAIKQAIAASPELPIEYKVRSIDLPIDLPDNSVNVVLDMMTSHFLKAKEREALRGEVLRVLRPGGWFFLKTFLADEDMHVAELLKSAPADEAGAYIHPKMGVYEYVYSEAGIQDFFAPYFEIHKLERSFKHIKDGKAFKRRTIAVYLQKPH